ncbi:hypothetical protein GCK72_001589 [Caenorhabditis remanei]|uniref:RRM domain-containing protein n=1 Tax=Caenorhabditis remanei TaxID=31234 RepID=A0A6A5HVJ2_CAERE|nr:hypothetical protein GCK72_001589 [Caenorhabditis remanei]KAF1769772.1 hypothetical protein GCK72_001589 [Caenorhabditis remanei]
MSEEVKQEVKQEAEEVKVAAAVAEAKTEEVAPAPEETPTDTAVATTEITTDATAETATNGAKPAENGSSGEPSKYADTENYKKLIGLKMKPAIADVVCEIYESGLLSPEDLDDRAVDIINSVNLEQAKFIFSEIKSSELFGVTTKSLYVTSLIRSFKDRCRQQGANAVTSGKLINGPELESLKKMLEDTGYQLEVTIGQRKVGGPPPDWDGPITGPAGSGHEIYVGHIPTDLFEDTLVPLFAESGKIWDFRLMMDPMTGASRGYAFVTYCEKEHATNAAKKFDGHEISTGKPLKVNVSIANTRLFLGNIPKTKSKDEILEELKSHAEGVTDVIVYSVPDNEKIRNRGFCFVDFIDHKTASDIKRKIAQHKIRPFNADVYVDWAEQQEEPDEDTMSKVKVLYIRNIKEAVTEEKLTELFKEYASLDRVKKVKDYAFIHFNERDDCMKAMEQWNGKELEGTVVEASLAKPPQEKKKKPAMRGRGFGGGSGGGNQGGRGGNHHRGGGGGNYGNHGSHGNQGNQGGYYPNQYGFNNGYDMPMPWGGGYGGDMGYGGYNGGGYGGPGAYGDFGGGYGGPAGFNGGGFRGGPRGSPRGGGFRGSPGRGGMANRRGRGKRPGDGRGGPASKRDNGKPDFTADVNMSTF